MKEINLGRILIENRHKRGITQEELAAYLGVSKAAVSKWETETTYPDITLLPQLAAYFLFHIGSLLVNHSMLAETQEKSEQILEEARELFLRVKYGTDNPSLSKEALQMEAYCLLALRQPAEVLNLLDTNELEVGSTEPLLASAYQMTGNTTQAPDRFTGNFFDCTDADRTRLSESAKCGGIPAKRCVFGYSCYFISSRTVHRGLTVKCVDFAGAWCSMCAACLVTPQKVYGTVHLRNTDEVGIENPVLLRSNHSLYDSDIFS